MSSLEETFIQLENSYLYDFFETSTSGSTVEVVYNLNLKDPRPPRSPLPEPFSMENQRKVLEMKTFKSYQNEKPYLYDSEPLAVHSPSAGLKQQQPNEPIPTDKLKIHYKHHAKTRRQMKRRLKQEK